MLGRRRGGKDETKRNPRMWWYGFRLGLGWVQNSRGGGVKKGGKNDGIYGSRREKGGESLEDSLIDGYFPPALAD